MKSKTRVFLVLTVALLAAWTTLWGQQEVDPWIPEQQAVAAAENQPAAAVQPLPPAQAPAEVRGAGMTRERAFRFAYLGMIMLDEEGALADLAPSARRFAQAAGRFAMRWAMLTAKVEAESNGFVYAE